MITFYRPDIWSFSADGKKLALDIITRLTPFIIAQTHRSYSSNDPEVGFFRLKNYFETNGKNYDILFIVINYFSQANIKTSLGLLLIKMIHFVFNIIQQYLQVHEMFI